MENTGDIRQVVDLFSKLKIFSLQHSTLDDVISPSEGGNMPSEGDMMLSESGMISWSYSRKTA